MADLAERYGAWLHVDGAFGLFAALSPRTAAPGRRRRARRLGHRRRPQVAERPVRVRLRVRPRRRRCCRGRSASGAAYLPDIDDPRPNWGYLRPGDVPAGAVAAGLGDARARTGARATARSSSATWTSRSPGRAWTPRPTSSGSPTCRSTSCASATGPRAPEAELDDLNRRIGEAALEDGRVFFGATRYGGRVGVPAGDRQLAHARGRRRAAGQVVRELGAKLGG